MKRDLYKTLIKLVLCDKTYCAFGVYQNGKMVARALSTIAPSRQLKLDKCGYISHFECINEQTVANALLTAVCNHLKERGAEHVEATYFPFDQDNRRGIQVCGFCDEPMFLTSYNPSYYGDLLEKFGFTKDFDTVSYKCTYNDFDFDNVERLKDRLLKRYDLNIFCADFSKIDREIADIHQIMCKAHNDIIFQEVPSIEQLQSIVKGWRNFLWSDLILIARKKDTNEPVGFVMAVPNFYFVFKKMKGSINPLSLIKMLYYKNKIRSMRIMLQYVIPKYQKTGANFLLYHQLYVNAKKRKIQYVEAGTIMEDNVASRINTEKAGGKLNKIFRIYGKNLKD
ncbi:MAG: hypothetical protein J6R37_00315 [Clostridia bacterium]|nr:hypothetical protein [Clostridia bacterium]